MCKPVLMVCLMISSGVCQTAAAATRRVLVDRSLAREGGDLIGFSEKTGSYMDAFGGPREDPAGGYLAILPPPGERSISWARPADEDLAGGTPVVVELTDGRRYIGALGPFASDSVHRPDAGDDSFALLTPGFGVRVVSLDDVGRIVVDQWTVGTEARAGGDAWDVQDGSEDVLIFRNGDRLSGFLVSFGDSIVFDAGDGEAAFGIGRVAEVRLGNPAEGWSGPRVWLATGEVLSARGAGAHDAGSVGLRDEPTGATVVYAVGAINAAWLGDGRVVALGSIEPTSVAPLGGRRWTAPVRTGSSGAAPLGAADIEMPGPMRVEWPLPAGADRFGTVARLGGTLADPLAAPGPWGDARLRTLVVDRGGEHELGVATLDRDHPSAMIAVELPGVGDPDRRLVLELLPGRYGPIQDRVLLDAPMLVAP
ncbi:MAG TPA: hypothetical protein ENK11_03860 [Phycisphaerales bacterium]|nr:hypothetical protein [Phycisphaerales bacterium]